MIDEVDIVDYISQYVDLEERSDEYWGLSPFTNPILYGSREKDAEMFNKNVDERFKDKIDEGIIPESQVENFKTAIEEKKRVFRKLNM